MGEGGQRVKESGKKDVDKGKWWWNDKWGEMWIGEESTIWRMKCLILIVITKDAQQKTALHMQ